jgi:hypothetical protein
MGYIYKADVYCQSCGDAIRVKLAATAPVDPLDHHSYDSDDYPKEASVERDEADCPQHCGKCGEFLRNPLTSEGYRYVQEALNATKLPSIYIGNMPVALKAWASWYDFTYWTAEDCADDGRHQTPGWYSQESY